MMKKFFAFTLLCVAVVFASCKDDDKTVGVSGIKLDQMTLNLIEGATDILTATITPENAENKIINWSSSAESVATVSSKGEVTAIKAGTATITATTADGGKTADCTVTVNATPKVGDYYYSDGTWSTTLNTGKNVIGIVFQTDRGRIGQPETTVLGGKTHGLVMSVKELSEQAFWGPLQIDEELQNANNLYSCYNDLSGLGNSQAIWTKAGVNLNDYAAFKAVKEFREAKATKAPEGTTGWFMPSMGQWWDILENLGGLETTLKKDRTNLDESKEYGEAGATAVQNINNYLNNVEGADLFVLFSYIYSSSEHSNNSARRLFISSEGDLYFNICNKNIQERIRCCLAF